MPELRNLLINVADLLAEPVGAGRAISGEVEVELDRDVAGAGVLVPRVPRRVPIPADGTAVVQVPVNDDPSIVSGRGFRVLVTLHLYTHNLGCCDDTVTVRYPGRVVTSSDPNPVAFADLVEPVEMPEYGSGSTVPAAHTYTPDLVRLAPVVRKLIDGHARIVVMGNENALGVGASSQSATWPVVLTSRLRSRFSSADVGAGGLSAGQGWWPPQFVGGAAPGQDGNNLDLRSVKLTGAGQAVRWSGVTASRLRVIYTDSLYQRGEADVLVDGAVVGTIDTRGNDSRHTPGAVLQTPVFGSGSHTVEVRWKSGAVDVAGIEATTSSGDAGVLTWHTGLPGGTVRGYANGEYWPAVLGAAAPDLVIVDVGVNDYPSGPDAVAGALLLVRLRVAAVAPSAVVIFLLDAPTVAAVGAGETDTVTACTDAAVAKFRDDDTTLVLPESLIWHPTTAGGDPSGWLSDLTHRSDYGQNRLAAWLFRLLTENAA